MPSHVRWIVETSEAARGTNRQVLSGYQLVIRKKSDTEDEVLDSREARLRALAPQRGQRHPCPHCQIPRSTNRPWIEAHGLHEALHGTQRGLGAQHEIGDAAGARSLDQAEHLRHAFVSRLSVTSTDAKDVNAGPSSEVQPMGADRGISGNQAQRRAFKQPLQSARVSGRMWVGQIDDHQVTRLDCMHRGCSGPMSCVDLGLQGAAERDSCATGCGENVYGGDVMHWDHVCRATPATCTPEVPAEGPCGYEVLHGVVDSPEIV